MIPYGSKHRSDDAKANHLVVVSSEDLLAGRRQLIIQHGPEQYRLQVTNSNKLILTK
jgi:hemin uptake protein HemP